ncbi:MAG: hypothetical protein ACOC0R_01100, partial [Mariniphaga sp.]
MNINTIQIESILSNKISGQDNGSYAVCWIQNEERDIVINNTLYEKVSNTVLFLNPNFSWEILEKESASLSGYVLFLPGDILNHPSFKNLHITEIRILNTSDIARIN